MIRRIKLLQRTAAGNSVSIIRTVIPQELDVLEKSHMSLTILGLEFAHTSDKDGVMQARFDVKCDRSTTTVDIRPPLAELITPNHDVEASDFCAAIDKLQGIHQRAVTKIDLSKKSMDLSSAYKDLPSQITKATNLVRCS